MSKRSAKITKDGQISIKLLEDEWLVLEKAFRTRMGLSKKEKLELWCLQQEVLEKLESRSKLTLKLRNSEFFTLFHQETFHFVHPETAILIESTFEHIRKEQVQAALHQRSTYKALSESH